MQYEDESKILEAMNNICLAPISNTHLELCVKIAEKCLGKEKIDLKKKFNPGKFTGGEYNPKFILKEGESLKGKTVYMLMTPGPFKEVEALCFRTIMTAKTAKENDADKVILLTTDFPHARQDRGPIENPEDPKLKGEGNMARMHADIMKAAGIDEVITIHEHSPLISAQFARAYGLITKGLEFNSKDPKIQEKIQQAGKKVFKTISPHGILADYLLYYSSLTGTKYLENNGEKIVLKAVDKGNVKFIENLRQALFLENISIIYCEKARAEKNDPTKVSIKINETSKNFETLDGAIEIYADDIADTFGTMIKSTQFSDQGNISEGRIYGTPEERILYFTHAVLAGTAHKYIQEKLIKEITKIKEIITTNTRDYIGNEQDYRFKTVSTILKLDILGDAILSNELGQDITTKYENFRNKEQQHEFLEGLYNIKRHERHFLYTRKKETTIPKIQKREPQIEKEK